MILTLTRYQSDHLRTFGRLRTSLGWECYTLELPWRQNEPRRRGDFNSGSCIPEGEYRLVYRQSPLISRLTQGRFTGGYEVVPVDGRKYIMIHQGNFPRHTDGCILVGLKPTAIGDAAEWGVPNSRATFAHLMGELKYQDEVPITIAWELAEIPPHKVNV